MHENWQKAEMLSEAQKQQYINYLKSGNHSAKKIIVICQAVISGIFLLMGLKVSSRILSVGAVLFFLVVLIIMHMIDKSEKALIKDIQNNQFQFFIEEARHIDEHNYINCRRNYHHGNVFLTNDVIFIQPDNMKRLHSFTLSAEDKTMSRIESLEWHVSLDFEKPDSLKLSEYLKNALEKADGIYIPSKKKNFSAKEYLNRTISFGKGSVFWEYANPKKRDKLFPKAFQWAFGVAEGMRYVTESDGEDSEVVMKNLYVSGLNCPPCYVQASEPVILIRNLSTGYITVRKLKFDN